ncbi:hypothetical protein [Polyangium aurulentum]|uniref:hypothetical protein n=1 Tax=Polyangium aurulentum TaxID=2567896 RepID=UPI0010AE9E9D|nr:hypothetical protein [Polyangium aurulentum]UQA60658.1 hypothetical protein E8A73_009345 [Polyangium aurulentum]
MKSMGIEWLGDDGPLVLLADAEAPGWLGAWREATDEDDEDDVEEVGDKRLVIDPDIDEDEPATDYARTCARLEPPVVAALVPYAGGTALGLETSGHQAALVADAAGVVIAKWVFAPSEEAADAALAALPKDIAWKDTGIVWQVPSRGVRLHVAGDRFEGEGIPFAIGKGSYSVETGVFEPDDETSFELWRLRRRG